MQNLIFGNIYDETLNTIWHGKEYRQFLQAFKKDEAPNICKNCYKRFINLSVIGGFILRLLNKEDDVGKEKQRKYIDIIKKESTKLEFLINDFLEFSRLQTGKLKLNFTPTSLDRELIELFEAYQPKASQSGINLEIRNEDSLPIIEADSNRLRRIFRNLMDNALKFSEQGGDIIITTRETDQDIVVEIMDKGTGIDPEDLPYIFDPYHRGQVKGKIEGFGIGLAEVKAIVESHGGQVLVSSELGKWSVFTVVLSKVGKLEGG